MTHWPKGMGKLSGQKTHFVEKIWEGLGDHEGQIIHWTNFKY